MLRLEHVHLKEACNGRKCRWRQDDSFIHYCFSCVLNRMAFQSSSLILLNELQSHLLSPLSLSFGSQQQQCTGRKMVSHLSPVHRPVMLNFGDLTKTSVFHHSHRRWCGRKIKIQFGNLHDHSVNQSRKRREYINYIFTFLPPPTLSPITCFLQVYMPKPLRLRLHTSVVQRAIK